MQFPDVPHSSQECPVCRAALDPDSAFCSECGTRQGEASATELRAVIYLLRELERWRAEGAISPAQASALSRDYERRREELRAQLASSSEAYKSIPPVLESSDAQRAEREGAPADLEHAASVSADEGRSDRPPAISSTLSRPSTPPPQFSRPHRTLLETLAEPYTLRLLLYTGAAMFVVGIIIWLRDVLYLKLQEPLVQAGLLIIGTIVLTASGWYTILRTRQRLTGRALTLTGSLLVPVNFWFLVRSGLIENRGRAWVVCAFCALLYAHTAALLREKLYVYLSCAAGVATGWALVYRTERDAPGLYALVLMLASMVFLHLSRLFPKDKDAATFEAARRAVEDEAETGKSGTATAAGRWSYELWGVPLVRAALIGALFCALVYMPLRLLGPSLSLYDGIFRLRARVYDPSMAMILFACIAYMAWFTGRYVDARRRTSFYTLAALALFWTQFLTMDGLRLKAAAQIAALAMTALVVSVAARRAQDLKLVRALYLSGVFVCVMLLPVAFAALLGAEAFTFMHSAGFALLACAFAALSAPRLCERAATRAGFGYAASILASTALLAALLSAQINSETLFTALCASWPFALYAAALVARREQRETQLATPLERTADALVVLLLLWGGLVALVLYLTGERPFVPRAAMFCALFGTLFYGLLRAAREYSAFGSGVASLASVVIVASSLDALQRAGPWPRAWPIAAGVIAAAFALRKASAKWFQPEDAQARDGGSSGSPQATIRLVMDGAVISCALLWFSTALALFDQGGFGAAWVLLLALVYWSERAARRRKNGPVYLAATHALAFFITILVALGTDGQWFAALIALVPVPLLFSVAGYARGRGAAWLAVPVGHAAVAAMALAFVAALLQAMPHLQAGDRSLLAPSVTMGALALVSLVVSIISKGRERVRFFRAGLYLSVVAYALACLRSGFEPLVDVEIYTSPVAILLILVAYVSFRREWDDYESDTSLLFWTGSILLAGPLLLRALQFRLLLDLPAPARDLATLCASLALLLFGMLGRLRAPVLVGAFALLTELAALALTSVDWLQVPLKIYLVTVGALLALVGWMFEYRREQLMLIRNRFNARREMARERFGEWR